MTKLKWNALENVFVLCNVFFPIYFVTALNQLKAKTPLSSATFLTDCEMWNIMDYAENHQNVNGMTKNLNQHHHVNKI